MRRVVLAVLAFAVVVLAPGAALAQYGLAATTVPTSIPTPAFGLTQTVASIHGSSTHYTHWVNNSVTCSDSTNGTPASPRCTFPTMTALAAGSVVQVRGGPYSMSANIAVGGTGTASNPIFVTTQGTASVTVDLNGARQVQLGGSYIIFEGFNLIDQDEAVAIGGDHNVFRYNEITGTSTNADANGSMISVGSSLYAVIAWNEVHDGGNWLGATETLAGDMHCLGLGDNSDATTQQYTWYLFNEVYHCGGDGFGNGHAANFTASQIYVGRNDIHDNRENAVDIKEVHSLIFAENHFHHQGDVDSAEGALAVVHYGPDSGSQQSPYNVWFLNNKFDHGVYGLVSTEVSNNTPNPGAWWIGNEFSDISGIAVNPDRGGGTIRVYHNTVNRSAGGIQSGGNSGGQVTISRGNIVRNLTGIGSGGYHMEVFNSTARSVSTVNTELYWQGGSNLSIYWGTTYTSLATFITGTTQGDNSIQADPQHVDPDADDYSLQSTSPAIDAGIDMASTIDTFESTFSGASLRVDIAGNARPYGVWDMGSREFCEGEDCEVTDPGDTTDPTVTITTPTSGTTHSVSATPLTSLAGTASDAVGVVSCTWANAANGGSGAATGTTSWSVASIALASGSNVITVTCVDAAANSGSDTLTVTYTPPATPAGSGSPMRRLGIRVH